METKDLPAIKIAESNKSPNLGAVARGRDNNLNLMRVLAALAVLLSHCFTLSSGNSANEPGRQYLGMTLGDISVDIFFIISGFLVTKSLSNSKSLREYAIARCLRIIPGLWVALLVTTAVVCLFFTSGTIDQYLMDRDVWTYLGRNAIVVTGAEFGFYGAFVENPYPYSVNASLWTLPLEVWMYIILAIAWAAAFSKTTLRALGFTVILRIIAVAVTCAAIVLDALGHPSSSLRHATVFFLAACLYGAKDRISLDHRIFLASIFGIAVAAFLSRVVFESTYRLLLPFVVLYLAYVPGGIFRKYNALGDYSYGLYIYAFPIQQMVVASMPGISTIKLFACSGTLTALCAFLSWHFVEEKALAWRARLKH